MNKKSSNIVEYSLIILLLVLICKTSASFFDAEGSKKLELEAKKGYCEGVYMGFDEKTEKCTDIIKKH